MNYKPEILNIAEICYQKGIKHAVISPGSRSTPLTLAFLRHGGIKCYIITDERSAGFTALGIAQQLQSPVVMICTSGTATLNYAPSVTEAFYQQVPLLLLTADRPPEWIDQFDNQSIRQDNIYNNHILKSYSLPVDTTHKDAKWHLERIISEAINISCFPVKGPVHVNVPLREPLYPDNEEFNYNKNVKTINLRKPDYILSEEIWVDLIGIFNKCENVLILGGMNNPDEELILSLKEIQKITNSVLISDITSNLLNSVIISHSDIILSKKEDLSYLKPDLLISFGNAVLSKSTKGFIKTNKPKIHWHIQESGLVGDTFQSLTDIINVSPKYFFEELIIRLDKKHSENNYLNKWKSLENKVSEKLLAFFDDSNGFEELNEFKAIEKILKDLPDNSLLQLGNSMPVRYANYIGINNKTIKVNANRGTSGIDGSISTSVGACLATDKITVLITGDLSFFYDRNGLWNNELPNKLRIIVMNNHGGGIFRILDGSSKLQELDKYFETENLLNAENTAKDFNLDYFKITNYKSLEENLKNFFDNSDRAKIMEIETDSKINTDFFTRFKKEVLY